MIARKQCAALSRYRPKDGLGPCPPGAAGERADNDTADHTQGQGRKQCLARRSLSWTRRHRGTAPALRKLRTKQDQSFSSFKNRIKLKMCIQKCAKKSLYSLLKQICLIILLFNKFIKYKDKKKNLPNKFLHKHKTKRFDKVKNKR